MSAALVSILIPCFNAAPWLEATLASAFAQTWPEKEIILVDDGSTDGSLALARRFETQGLKIIAQPNRGASAARNAALAASRGAWLQFLDADDLLAPDKIEQQMNMAALLGPSFLLAARWSRFVRVPEETASPDEPLCIDAAPVDWMVAKFEQNAMMHPAAWLVSRELAQRIGLWDTQLSLDDDGEYFGRAVLASSGVRTCRPARSYYRSRLSSSLSGRKSDAAWASAFRSIALSTARLVQKEDSARTRHAAATAYQRFIYEAYPACRALRAQAAQEVSSLGGCSLRYQAGPKFSAVQSLLGWKAAKRLARVLQRA